MMAVLETENWADDGCLSCLATACIQLKYIARKHMQANGSNKHFYVSSRLLPTAPLSLEIEDVSKAKHGRHRM